MGALHFISLNETFTTLRDTFVVFFLKIVLCLFLQKLHWSKFCYARNENGIGQNLTEVSKFCMSFTKCIHLTNLPMLLLIFSINLKTGCLNFFESLQLSRTIIFLHEKHRRKSMFLCFVFSIYDNSWITFIVKFCDFQNFTSNSKNAISKNIVGWKSWCVFWKISVLDNWNLSKKFKQSIYTENINGSIGDF